MSFNIQAYAEMQIKYRQVSRALRCRGEKGSGVKIPRGAAAVLAWPLYDVTVRMYGKAKRPISLSQKTCLSGYSPCRTHRQQGKTDGQRTLWLVREKYTGFAPCSCAGICSVRGADFLLFQEVRAWHLSTTSSPEGSAFAAVILPEPVRPWRQQGRRKCCLLSKRPQSCV